MLRAEHLIGRLEITCYATLKQRGWHHRQIQFPECKRVPVCPGGAAGAVLTGAFLYTFHQEHGPVVKKQFRHRLKRATKTRSSRNGLNSSLKHMKKNVHEIRIGI